MQEFMHWNHSARSLVGKGLQAAFSATSVELAYAMHWHHSARSLVAGGLAATSVELAYALQSLMVVELSRNPLTCDPNPELGLATGGGLGLDYALTIKWEHLLVKLGAT
jgi:hypothetical protein